MSGHECGPGCPEHAEGAVEALAELAKAEAASTAEPAVLLVPPFTAFVLIAALQLAWRHPDLNPAHKGVIERVARSLQRMFGPPLYGELDRGWDVTQDYDPRAGGTP